MPSPDASSINPGSAPRRAALVVGGTGRIGRVVVRAVAAAGFDVAVHCHAALPAARELAAAVGGRSLAVTADLREEGAVRAVVHRVADHFAGLDAVVIAAGRRRPTPLEELTVDDLRAHFEVNVAGGCVVTQEAGAVMRHQPRGGVIVWVGCRSAPNRPGDAPYLATTPVIPALVRGLAAEFADRDPLVRVGCVEAGDEDPSTVAAAVVARLASP